MRCALGCKSNGKPLHRFPNPHKFPLQFEAWVNALGETVERPEDLVQYRCKRICHIHFKVEDLNRHSRLKVLTVPSLYLPAVATGDPSDTPDNAAVEDTLDKNTRAEDTVAEDTVANDDQGDDLANDCDDVPDPVVPDFEKLPRELFSWEKTDAIVADDTEMQSSVIVQDDPEMTLDLGDMSMYNEEQLTKDHSGEEHTAYRCNECEKTINGFRYMCVQCVDFDLCAACEARGAHAHHYVLRVPGDRPYKEIQTVLAAIRHQMLSENLFLPETIASVKEEVKDEEEAPESALEPDPLGALDVSFRDDDCDILENLPEQNYEHEDDYDEDDRPPRKRRRTSLDPFDNAQDTTPHDDLITLLTDDPLETLATSDDQTFNSTIDSNHTTFINVDQQTNRQRKPPSTNPTDSGSREIVDVDTTNAPQSNKLNDNNLREILDDDCIEMPGDTTVSGDILDACNTKPKPVPPLPPKLQKLEMYKIKIPKYSTVKTGSQRSTANTGQKRSAEKTDVKTSAASDVKGITINNDDKKSIVLTNTRPVLFGDKKSTAKAVDKSTASSGYKKSNTKDKSSRLRIRLPPDMPASQMVAMLKTKVTVRLEDVMRKKAVHKKTEIKEI